MVEEGVWGGPARREAKVDLTLRHQPHTPHPDTQMCLWSFLTLLDYPPFSGPSADTHNIAIMAVIVLTSVCLFALEAAIAAVRTGDYFRAKYTPASATKGAPALRAVSEGKLKQKFEVRKGGRGGGGGGRPYAVLRWWGGGWG